MVFTPSAHECIVHRYTARLVALEHARPGKDDCPNTLIWIGGLGDGLLTVDYPTTIARNLPPNWALAEVLLSSSYKGWASSSLTRDVKELSSCVDYFRKLRPGAKIVLMGHSTGSQDVMEYLVGEGNSNRPPIQGGILQGSVSDREALRHYMGDTAYENSVAVARQWISEGRGDDMLPSAATNNIFGFTSSASRWLSLASPDKRGQDDYFSSDLDLDQLKSTFGRLPKESPLLILYSGSDEHVPTFVNRRALVAKWFTIIKEGGGAVDEENGGIVPKAHHNLNGDSDEVVMDLVGRVNGFLKKLEQGGFKG